MSGDPEKTIDRVAHALTPSAWKGRSLAIMIVVFAAVLSVTVIQRALVADTTSEWVLTAVHGTIVAAIIPLLAIRAVNDWRAAHGQDTQSDR